MPKNQHHEFCNTNSQSSNEGETQKQGAEFMALRVNVRDKRRELRRDLQPLENYLLDDIAEGTINKWVSLGEFDLKDLAFGLDIELSQLYRMLKKLSNKSLIIRKPTRYRGREVLGLNPEFFGQILIDHQNEIEKKIHLKLVPNNQQQVPVGTKPVPKSNGSNTNRYSNIEKSLEIIDEKPPIDSYRSIQISLDGNPNEFPEPNTGGWDPEGPQKAQEILKKIKTI